MRFAEVTAHARRFSRGGVVAMIVMTSAGAVGCAAPSATERALTLTRHHEDEQAIATLRADLAVHPEHGGERRLLIRLLGLTGDLNAARVEVAELERRSPDGDPSGWIELGHALELAHRFEEALAAYDSAAAAAPLSPMGPREGGMRCARWGETEEARPRLEEAVRRGAKDAETWHALGLVRVHLGDLDAAMEAYRAGTAADPRGAENWLGLATVAVMKGDAPGALAAYDAIVERRPGFGAAELGRAWALAKMGRKEDARHALDRAEELGAPRANVAKQRAALAAQLPVSTATPNGTVRSEAKYSDVHEDGRSPPAVTATPTEIMTEDAGGAPLPPP